MAHEIYTIDETEPTIDYITKKWSMPIPNWNEAMAHLFFSIKRCRNALLYRKSPIFSKNNLAL